MLVFLACQVLLVVTDHQDEMDEMASKVIKEEEACQEKKACREREVTTV